MSCSWVTPEETDFFILSFPIPLLHLLMVSVAQSLHLGCSELYPQGRHWKNNSFLPGSLFAQNLQELDSAWIFFPSDIKLQLTNGSKTWQVGYTQAGGCSLRALASFLGGNYLISCLGSDPNPEFWEWNIPSAAVPSFTIILQTPKMQCYLSG